MSGAIPEITAEVAKARQAIRPAEAFFLVGDMNAQPVTVQNRVAWLSGAIGYSTRLMSELSNTISES